MLTRISGALVRAILMALLVASPSLLMSDVSQDTSQIIVLFAILAFLFTFVEYNSQYPSLVEFRYAPPYNRLRYAALLITVVSLALTSNQSILKDGLAAALRDYGESWGVLLDFPYSPVRLMVLMMPDGASEELVAEVRTAAGLAYSISLFALFIFASFIRLLGWPTRRAAFNVWINLPIFDPTAGGDVVQRLRRDASLNVILGVLLPFLIPTLVKVAASFVDPLSLAAPQTLVWTMTAWAFLPASIIMRGLALGRVAELIAEKRERTYSQNNQQALGHPSQA